ncbi:uncharacterized protein LOC126655698 isoform X1 [Mercurialis annua]|uniref:uncharacterized protein LOC126655698 isoform X1 n=1 Tax=Mercurialis annua TaxID=3986 RepID=UPI0021605F39|nr:uncharacterized protein LOC126655698 isoform X1 [Mercurialis annua]
MYPKPPPFSEFGFSILICCSKVTLSVNATSHRLTHLFKMAESSSMSPKPGSKMLGSDHSSTASPLPYTEVVVVRHGETEWNADGRLQGHLDVLLNDTGRQQAAAVANRLSKEPKIAAIYSSDLKRALTTAEIIAASCGGLEVVEDGDLRERHLGQLQGLVLRDTAKVNPEAYQAFLSRRTSQDIPSQRSKCKMEANNSLRPLFNGSDYAFWKFKMEKFLDSESINLWHCIRKGWSFPTKAVDGVQIEKSRDDWNRNEEALYLKNNECMIMLATSLSRDEGGKIAHCTSAREMWTTLENHHEGTSHVKAIKKELLIRDYNLFKHKIGENVTEMTNRLLQIVRTLRKYDKICSKKDVNDKILYSLPNGFEARVTAIIEAHDLSKLNTDELIGKLIAHEMTYGKDELKEKKMKCLEISKCKMEANNSLMPLFNGSDYAFWKFKMEKFLDSESINLWHCIRKGWSFPTKEADGVQIEKSRDDWNLNEEALYLKNNECMIMLATSLSRDEGGKIAHCTSAREIWTTLENHHEGTSHVKAIKKELLIREYNLFKHKIGENVTEMTNRLLQIVRTLRKYDKICSKTDINYKILYSLPKIGFEARVTAIIEAHDLSKLNTDELIGKLIAHEMTYGKELIKESKKCLALKARVESFSSEDGSIENDYNDDTDKAIWHCLQKQNQIFQSNKDRRNCTILQKCSKRDENKMKCYECGRKGHMRSECPKLEESPSRWHKKDKGVEAKRKGYTATWSDYYCDEEDVDNKNDQPNYCLRATID